MINLPEDIILEILSRLPPKSLLSFKSVCKPWRILISDYNFIKLNLHRAIKQDCPNLLLSPYGPFKRTNHLYSMQGSNLLNQAIEIEASMGFDRLIGTDHGLVCYKDDKCNICLLNPSTGECKEFFTEEKDFPTETCRFYGFAYDTTMDDYLFVRGFRSVISVYSLKFSLCLKTFDMPPIAFVEVCFPAVYLKGSLHWLAYKSDLLADKSQQQKVIVTFHITEKVIGELSLPSGLDAYSWFTMGNFQGQLCILYHAVSDFYDMSIWVMKSYGRADSWSKIYSDRQGHLRDEISTNGEPIALLYVSKSGEILANNGKKLVVYDPKENTFRDITIQGIQNDHRSRLHTIMTYVPSLVPVNFGTLADESKTSNF